MSVVRGLNGPAGKPHRGPDRLFSSEMTLTTPNASVRRIAAAAARSTRRQ